VGRAVPAMLHPVVHAHGRLSAPRRARFHGQGRQPCGRRPRPAGDVCQVQGHRRRPRGIRLSEGRVTFQTRYVTN